jgi:hypothetical protein
MVTATIDWDGKQNVVRITDSEKVIIVPLDDFVALPAVQYVIGLQLSQAGQRRRVKRTKAADAGLE